MDFKYRDILLGEDQLGPYPLEKPGRWTPAASGAYDEMAGFPPISLEGTTERCFGIVAATEASAAAAAAGTAAVAAAAAGISAEAGSDSCTGLLFGKPVYMSRSGHGRAALLSRIAFRGPSPAKGPRAFFARKTVPAPRFAQVLRGMLRAGRSSLLPGEKPPGRDEFFKKCNNTFTRNS